MATKNIHMPRIVRNVYGLGTDRTTERLPMLDGAAIYLGGFVPAITGDFASGDGIEFGVPAFTDDSVIYGIAVGFFRRGSALPIEEDDKRAGTITQPTGELPLKYTAASDNDEGNASPELEEVEVLPIHAGDIIEVTLWGGSTTSVDRGTTTAAGTTDSSANIGVGLSVDSTYHFALTESTGDKDLTDVDFMTWQVDGQKPANQNRVYARLVRGFAAFNAADAS